MPLSAKTVQFSLRVVRRSIFEGDVNETTSLIILSEDSLYRYDNFFFLKIIFTIANVTIFHFLLLKIIKMKKEYNISTARHIR